LIFSSSFGVLTLQYVPAVPQPDAKDRLSDDARVVSNRRRYLLEVDLRISNHSERPFCAPNLTFVSPIRPTTGMAESDMNKSSWQKPASLHTAAATKSIGALIGGELMPPDWRASG